MWSDNLIILLICISLTVALSLLKYTCWPFLCVLFTVFIIILFGTSNILFFIPLLRIYQILLSFLLSYIFEIFHLSEYEFLCIHVCMCTYIATHMYVFVCIYHGPFLLKKKLSVSILALHWFISNNHCLLFKVHFIHSPFNKK